MKRIAIITISLVLCLLLSACSSLIEPIDYSQNGIQITLDTSYNRSTISGYTACYRSSVATVYMLREAFGDTVKEDMSLADYAKAVQSTNDLHEEISEHNGYLSFTYETIVDEIHLTTFVALYKMSDCFWTVQFMCDGEYFESLKSSFEEYADSVKDVKTNAAITEQG